ncbi:MAG: sulfatase-like hydrolase/transferase [Pseudomonadota bacterium]
MAHKAQSMKQVLVLAVGAIAVFGVFALPNHPDALTWGALNRWPLELPVVLLSMMVLGRRAVAINVIALALVVLATVKVADLGMFSAYNRAFNPIVDGSLIGAGLSLLHDSMGTAMTVAVVLTAMLVSVAFYVVLVRGLMAWADLGRTRKSSLAAGLVTVGCVGWAVADAGHHLKHWRFENSPPGTTWSTRLAIGRIGTMQATLVDLAEFRADAQSDIYSDRADLLNRLDGHDVILIWIESYGRASFDNPLYAPTHLATLDAAQTDIAGLGLAMKSGWLMSPTAGGQSWLAHGALGSGLWTSGNGRYQAMIGSGKKWLFDIARDAGYRTTAVMPAITRDWPESAAMGFDLIFAEAAIPYAGAPFHWVTMPDQFTLASYRELLSPDPRPEFIQIALISSHAPWTPVPDMVGWDDIGDGTIFNAMATRGPEPKVLWKDRNAVRDAYRRSLDYVLQAVFSHVVQTDGRPPVFIIAGDHQAAGFVAGSDNKDVPVHFVGPQRVLDQIDHWGWSDGLIPDADVPVRRMDSFRDDFIAAFSGELSTAMVAE